MEAQEHKYYLFQYAFVFTSGDKQPMWDVCRDVTPDEAVREMDAEASEERAKLPADLPETRMVVASIELLMQETTTADIYDRWQKDNEEMLARFDAMPSGRNRGFI